MTTTGHDDISAAGLRAIASGLYGDGGYPTGGPMRPASVAIDGGYLRWSLLTGAAHPFDPRGMIDRFARIKTPGGVLRFARDHGVLGLCAHGFPVMQHWAPPHRGPEPGDGCDPWAVEGRESLEDWYHYARRAWALMQIAIDLAHARQPPRAWWETVLERLRRADGVFPPQAQLLLDHMAAAPAVCLYAQVNEWARLGNVRPMLITQGPGARPALNLVGSIFGLLGVQLMTIITGAANVATCSCCGEMYLRDRLPQRGRANYCPKPTCKSYGAKIRKRRQRAGLALVKRR